MKKGRYSIVVLGTLIFSITAFVSKQTEPWTADQLMKPGDLAAIIKDSSARKALIINIGPVNQIKGAIKIGPTREKDGLKSLKKLVEKEDKKRMIIIYCGCCPFKDCPNIRPAFSLLNEMKFVNHKLLNLPHNLKVDWINFGYPME